MTVPYEFSDDTSLISPLAKSAEAYRTISEVALLLDIPQHVLRFWETRFGEIKPLKRGGGRRYYTPETVELIRQIKHLLYKQGYTIRGVQQVLKSTRGLKTNAPSAAPLAVFANPAAESAAPILPPPAKAAHGIDPEKVASLQAMADQYGLDPVAPEKPQMGSAAILASPEEKDEKQAPAATADVTAQPERSVEQVIVNRISPQNRTRLSKALDELKALKKLVDSQRGQ